MQSRLIVVFVCLLGTLAGWVLLELCVLAATLRGLNRLELLCITVLLECFLHEDIKGHSVAVGVVCHDLGRTCLILS